MTGLVAIGMRTAIAITCAIEISGCAGLPGGPQSAAGAAGYELVRSADGACRISVASGRDLSAVAAEIDGTRCTAKVDAGEISSDGIAAQALGLAGRVLDVGVIGR